jgi:hypothetical protein
MAVTREGTRLLTAIVAAVLVAGLLGACGDSDSDSSGSSGSAAAEETSSGSGGSSAAKGEAGGSEEGDGSEAEGGDGSQGDSDKPAPEPEPVATPLEVSGGGSEQFIVKGGDNSIQEFGEESDDSELEEAAEAVHDFYVARAEGRWEDACAHLSESLLERLEQLAKSSTALEDKSCPPFLEAFTSELTAAEWRTITTVDAGSLRQEGEQGFLVYYGAPEKTAYAMPLAREDDEWKVTALSASALG